MDVNLVVLFGSFTPSHIALLFLTLRANSPHISLFNMLYLYYNQPRRGQYAIIVMAVENLITDILLLTTMLHII